jgi:tRNA-dihydrouridine synthase C
MSGEVLLDAAALAAGGSLGGPSPGAAPEPYLPGLPYTAPGLLAPMEGVTDPCFRDLIFSRQGPEALGGATTEFLRVVDVPVSRRCIEATLGERRWPQPVALQLMGSHAAALGETVRRAVDLGVPLIDLNFGCPAKGAVRTCAGSGLLDQPGRLEELVRTAVLAAGAVPVSAKLRAGISHDRDVERLVCAAEAGGAALITLHCRTREEGYRDCADWERLRRATRVLAVPLCGNGGIEQHADLERLRRETGCQLAMVGRAALADPWIFSGRQVTRAEAAQFLIDYWHALCADGAATPTGALSRLKQMFRFFRAGGLIAPVRQAWLHARDPDTVRACLERIAAGSPEEEPPGTLGP